RDLHDRTDFDRAQARAWNTRGNAYSLVEVPGVEEELATQLSARLREWTVGHEPLAVTHPDAGRRRDRVQWVGAQIMPARVKFLRELRGLNVTMFTLSLTQGLLVKINQQQISHLSASIGLSNGEGQNRHSARIFFSGVRNCSAWRFLPALRLLCPTL